MYSRENKLCLNLINNPNGTVHAELRGQGLWLLGNL